MPVRLPRLAAEAFPIKASTSLIDASSVTPGLHSPQPRIPASFAGTIARALVEKGVTPPYSMKASDAAGFEISMEMNQQGRPILTNFLRRDQRHYSLIFPITLRVTGNFGQQHTLVLTDSCGCESRKAMVS
jgi:hypothetical protein